jgi:YD repeat-containing protein
MIPRFIFLFCLSLASVALFAQPVAIRGVVIGEGADVVSVSGCDSLSFSVEGQEQGGTAELVGFQEFDGQQSSPPKRYLEYSISGQQVICSDSDLGNCNFGSGTGSGSYRPVENDRYYYSRSDGEQVDWWAIWGHLKLSVESVTTEGNNHVLNLRLDFDVFDGHRGGQVIKVGNQEIWKFYNNTAPGTRRKTIKIPTTQTSVTASIRFYIPAFQGIPLELNPLEETWYLGEYILRDVRGFRLSGSACVDEQTGEVCGDTNNLEKREYEKIRSSSCSLTGSSEVSDLSPPVPSAPTPLPGYNAAHESRDIYSGLVVVDGLGECIGGEKYCETGMGRRYELKGEYTEQDAIDRIESLSEWTGVGDYFDLSSVWGERTSGFSFPHKKARFRIAVDNSQNEGTYEAAITYESRSINSEAVGDFEEAETVTISFKVSSGGTGTSFSDWIELPFEHGKEFKIRSIEGEILPSVNYKASFDSGCGEHLVTWTIHETPCGGGATTSHQRQALVHLDNGGETQLQTLRGREGYTLTVDPRAVAVPLEGCGDCGANGQIAGMGAGPGSGSVDWSIPLGQDALAQSYGVLWLYAPRLADGLGNPDQMLFIPGAAEAELIQAAGNPRRQIRTPQTAVDLKEAPGGGYTVEFYHNAAVSQAAGAEGYFSFSGAPYLTWGVVQTVDELEITRTFGGQETVFTYSESTPAAGQQRLVLDRADLQRIDKLTTTDASDPSLRTVTTTISTPNLSGTVASKTTKTFRDYEWGTVRTSKILDPDGEALTTTWEYELNEASASFGRVLFENRPDGTKLSYEYDAGTGELRYKRHLQPDHAGDETVLVEEGFSRVRADFDGDGIEDQRYIEYRSDHAFGTTLSYRLVSGARSIVESELVREVELQRPAEVQLPAVFAPATPADLWNATDNPNRVTRYREFVSGPFLGQPVWRLNPDGTMETWSYSLDESTGEVTTVHERGQADAEQGTVVAGTRATRTVAASGTLLREEYVDIGSGTVLDSSEVLVLDDYGRPERTQFFDGTSEIRDYACCGLSQITSRSGAVTSFTYDALGRTEFITSNHGELTQIVEQRGYDAADNVKEVKFGRWQHLVSLTTEYDYSLSGEQTHRRERWLDNAPSTDRQTVIAREYLDGNKRITTTYPNGSTRIEEYYPTGRLYQTTGTAVFGQRYQYISGTEPSSGQDVAITKVTALDADGETTAEYRKTYENALGQVLREESPSSNGGTSVSLYAYDTATGQLLSSEDPDGIVTLYAYNDRGELELRALDVNGDGQITYEGENADRIIRMQTTYVDKTEEEDNEDKTYRVERTTWEVWETDGANDAAEIRVVERSLGPLPDGGGIGSVVWDTLHGKLTKIETVRLSGMKQVRTTTFNDGSILGERLDDGLMISRFSKPFDSLGADLIEFTTYEYELINGRFQIEYADDRYSGKTEFDYYGDGQLKSVLTDDPDGHLSYGDVHPQMVTFNYTDSLSLVSRTTTLADQSTREETFYPTGRLKAVSGSQTYPVEYRYDHTGRLLSQRTWQDASQAASAVVTVWEYYPNGQLKQKWYDASIAPGGAISGTAGPRYTYTPAGRLASRQNARGTTATYAYDPNTSDLTELSYDDALTPTVSYSNYDRLGRPRSLTDASGTRELIYENGRLMDEIYNAGPLDGYEIDRHWNYLVPEIGNPTNVSYELALTNNDIELNHFVTTRFENGGRLDSVESGGYSVDYAYSASSLGSYELRHFKNGSVPVLNTYESRDRIGRLKERELRDSTDLVLESYAYGFNDLNQRKEKRGQAHRILIDRILRCCLVYE